MNTISSALSPQIFHSKYDVQTWFRMGPRLVNGNKNGGAMWTDYVVNVYCEKLQGNGTKTCQPHTRGFYLYMYNHLLCPVCLFKGDHPRWVDDLD